MKKIICTLIAFALFLSFVSCASSQNDIDGLFSELMISDVNEDETDAYGHIYIVIPSGCSGELSLKARELSDAIGEKTGILTTLKYDSELSYTPNDSLEILLGYTNRLASKNATDTLRSGDYVCCFDNGAVVICGRSDDATILAIDRFMSDVLPGMTNTYIVSKDVCIRNVTEYDISKIVLQGYDLYDYTIVYQKDSRDAKRMALELRNFINFKSGYLLDVSESIENTVRRILLLDSEKENAIIPDENGIVLSGDDCYSLSCVVAEFARNIKEKSADGVLDMKYDGKVSVADGESSVKALFYTVKKQDGQLMPTYQLLTAISTLDVDICVIGNSDENMIDGLENTFKNDRDVITLELDSRKISFVYKLNSIRNVSATVHTDLNAAEISFETANGEKMRGLYALNADAYAVSDRIKNDVNVFAFFEGGSVPTDQEAFSVISSGSAYQFDYSLALCENLYSKNQSPAVVNDEYRFYVMAELGNRYSFDFLNDALK